MLIRFALSKRINALALSEFFSALTNLIFNGLHSKRLFLVND